jgi:hypothetical protein
LLKFLPWVRAGVQAAGNFKVMFEFEKLIERVTEAVKIGSQNALDDLTKEFNTPVQNFVKTQWVSSNCSDILFINYTPITVLTGGNIEVNNYILQPGGFIGFSGNNAEINRDQYNVVFGPNATLCTCVKKLYTKK